MRSGGMLTRSVDTGMSYSHRIWVLDALNGRNPITPLDGTSVTAEQGSAKEVALVDSLWYKGWGGNLRPSEGSSRVQASTESYRYSSTCHILAPLFASDPIT